MGLNKKQYKEINKFSNMVGIMRTDNQKELVKIYSISDYFFNPTYEDNYPTVNLEANSCGLKVITYDTGGCKEINYYKIIKPGNYKEVIKYLK